MNSNLGHTIQRILNNAPRAIAANDISTTVLTNGGDLFQAGLIHNKVHCCFKDVDYCANVQGCIIEIASTETALFILTDLGDVYEVYYDPCGCDLKVKQIFFHDNCCDSHDGICSIKAGRKHLVMKTRCNKIYGYGDNREYQLVPQGESQYDYAVRILISDINIVNAFCHPDYLFAGKLSIPSAPSIDVCGNATTCIQGSIVLTDASISLDTGSGPVPYATPVDISINYSYTFTAAIAGTYSNGFLNGTISTINSVVTYGSANVTLDDNCNNSQSLIPSGAYVSVSALIGTGLPQINVIPATGTGLVNFPVRFCDDNLNLDIPVVYNVNSSPVTPPFSAPINTSGISITYQFAGQTTVLTITNSGNVGQGVPLGCTASFTVDVSRCPEFEVKQPCINNIYAGFDQTAFSDDVGRIYVLGSIYEIRDNAFQLKRNCLDPLLDNSSRIQFEMPANQINCRGSQTTGCDCRDKRCNNGFCTDLSKIKVKVDFDKNQGCASESVDACNFLRKLQECNSRDLCNNTCEPCENVIFVSNVCQSVDPRSNPTLQVQASITANLVSSTLILLNRRSVDRVLARMNNPGVSNIELDDLFNFLLNGTNSDLFVEVSTFDNNSSRIDFDPIQLQIDNISYPLDRVIILGSISDFVSTQRTCTCPVYFTYPLPTLFYIDIDKGPRSVQMLPLLDNINGNGTGLGNIDFGNVGQVFSDGKFFEKFNILFNPDSMAGFVTNVLGYNAYPPETSSLYPQFPSTVLNYGYAMAPVVLNNLKAILGNFSYKNNPRYTSPILNKVYNIYVRPVDRILISNISYRQLISGCGSGSNSGIRVPGSGVAPLFPGFNPINSTLLSSTPFMVTADVPTLFNFNRRVIDVALGDNSITVVVTGFNCPNDVFALGNNCYGQLGLCDYFNTLCWRKVDNCQFNCQISKVYANCKATFYVSSKGNVYAAGFMSDLFNCPCPKNLTHWCGDLKIKELAVSKNNIVLLTHDDCLFGWGTNQLGQLGLCHTDEVCRPTPLSFFHHLNKCALKTIQQLSAHPVLSRDRNLSYQNQSEEYALKRDGDYNVREYKFNNGRSNSNTSSNCGCKKGCDSCKKGPRAYAKRGESYFVKRDNDYSRESRRVNSNTCCDPCTRIDVDCAVCPDPYAGNPRPGDCRIPPCDPVPCGPLECKDRRKPDYDEYWRRTSNCSGKWDSDSPKSYSYSRGESKRYQYQNQCGCRKNDCGRCNSGKSKEVIFFNNSGYSAGYY
jgi:alpha-tubulin suppressor-like RCC1 family protein